MDTVPNKEKQVHRKQSPVSESSTENSKSPGDCRRLSNDNGRTSSVNNFPKNHRVSKHIVISSQSDSEASQSTPRHNLNSLDKNKLINSSLSEKPTTKYPSTSIASKLVSKVQSCVSTLQSDSEDEFGISEPSDSVDQNSSDSEFKISQISDSISEDKGSSSGEEFRLSSEDEKSGGRVRKKKTLEPSKSKDEITCKTTAPITGNPQKTPTKEAPKTESDLSTKTRTLPKTQFTSDIKSVPGRKKEVTSTVRKSIVPIKTVNIPAILSSGSQPRGGGIVSSSSLSRGAIKIGLSKNAKFKSLHANIKRQ